MTWLWLKIKQGGGVTQVLVHVSTCQGSILVPVVEPATLFVPNWLVLKRDTGKKTQNRLGRVLELGPQTIVHQSESFRRVGKGSNHGFDTFSSLNGD